MGIMDAKEGKPLGSRVASDSCRHWAFITGSIFPAGVLNLENIILFWPLVPTLHVYLYNWCLTLRF